MFDIASNTEFLTEIGINDASEEVKAKLIAGIENLAKERLITKISDKLSDEKAEEFGKITDEKEAADWINANLPDFPAMVTEVFDEIKTEILAHKANVIGE